MLNEILAKREPYRLVLSRNEMQEFKNIMHACCEYLAEVKQDSMGVYALILVMMEFDARLAAKVTTNKQKVSIRLKHKEAFAMMQWAPNIVAVYPANSLANVVFQKVYNLLHQYYA